MAYKFVDTIEAPGDEEMPAEAMKLNGEYIENLMDARYCTYRTLYVKGREMLSPDLTSYETGVRDGSVLQSKKYPSRTITVGYKLQATSNYWFRVAYNELMRILNVENAELIFYDEQDKYFTGTPQKLGSVDPGTNFVQGEFDILCNDPFKYSVTEYEAEPTEDDGRTFVVDYGGTYKGYPTLEADFAVENEFGDDGNTPEEITGDADCGYVAWFNQNEKIIQLGDPEEEEGEEYDKSQTLFTQDFRQIDGWTEPLNNVWEKNKDLYNMGSSGSNSILITGTPGFPAMNSTEYYMGAEDYGSAGNYQYCGPAVSRTLPADATGETEASDWTLKWWQKMAIGGGASAMDERGILHVTVSDANGKFIIAINMSKNTASAKGSIYFHINQGPGAWGSPTKTVNDIDYSWHNARWGENTSDITTTKACSIVKEGTNLTVNLGGTTWSFTDANIADLKAVRVQFVFLRNRNYTPLTFNGVYQVSFTKNNCTTWADIPNKFTNNDIVTAQCSNGMVYMNGSEAPEYGALGNDWETFTLEPGYNQIGFSYSDWCEKPPTTKMRYREVFL